VILQFYHDTGVGDQLHRMAAMLVAVRGKRCPENQKGMSISIKLQQYSGKIASLERLVC
jgi:hypothetical protein